MLTMWQVLLELLHIEFLSSGARIPLGQGDDR